jgi:hypothetical protein
MMGSEKAIRPAVAAGSGKKQSCVAMLVLMFVRIRRTCAKTSAQSYRWRISQILMRPLLLEATAVLKQI